LYDKSYFAEQSCKLDFLDPTLPFYQQGSLKEDEFVAGLSMIDVLMWNEIKVSREMVQKYNLL
jgi:hypothetical protein